MNLNQAVKAVESGRMSAKDWAKYAHEWQTSSPRLAIRACNCAQCVVKFPETGGYIALKVKQW